ncbi:MAG: hypothetical protein M1840_000919 [Geoglossum simile]|nr:MAG: hypothetical protein M1840_000919 [Geoglossum simile]
MADSGQMPRVGSQPESDHATQLLADIATLRDYRTSVVQKSRSRNVAWTTINAVFESIEGYIKKNRDQPPIKELQTDLHAAEKANGSLRKDVTLIKNTLESLAGDLVTSPRSGIRLRTRVPNAKPLAQQMTQSISVERVVEKN